LVDNKYVVFSLVRKGMLERLRGEDGHVNCDSLTCKEERGF
jgi:hypothetical protein